ncbi:hypothetical protein CM318V1_590011 [Carnobacterium maltaromaticum]|nr:hypothetical protein CM318V1_590011 [Carnobacterium maltaromaticum]
MFNYLIIKYSFNTTPNNRYPILVYSNFKHRILSKKMEQN